MKFVASYRFFLRCLSVLVSIVMLSVVDPLLAQSAPAWSYAMPISVKQAFDAGDHAPVAQFFSSTVELRLPNGNGIYSKKQAEMILGEYFAQHKGMVFSVDHEESVGVSTLTIGNLSLGAQKFRVYILSHLDAGAYSIKQFRIEELKS